MTAHSCPYLFGHKTRKTVTLGAEKNFFSWTWGSISDMFSVKAFVVSFCCRQRSSFFFVTQSECPAVTPHYSRPLTTVFLFPTLTGSHMFCPLPVMFGWIVYSGLAKIDTVVSWFLKFGAVSADSLVRH